MQAGAALKLREPSNREARLVGLSAIQKVSHEKLVQRVNASLHIRKLALMREQLTENPVELRSTGQPTAAVPA